MSVFKGARGIYMGADELDQLFDGKERIFIVCDPFIVDSGMDKYLTEKLEQMGKDYMVYSKVAPDPSIDLVVEAIKALQEYNADCIIAFGGGAAIDESKAMKYFAEEQGIIKDCTFAVIPTTSGTGSEVTDFAIITDADRAVKCALIRPEIVPDAAILDAELTKSVPPAITAATGMDALTHSIEAIVAKNATDFSDASAEKAIKLIRSYLLKCYRHPSDLYARQRMHNAATMAGVAFTNAGLGLVHSMAHTIGAHFHIPHGEACAVMLPYVVEFNAGIDDSEVQPCCKNYARIARLIKVDKGTVRQSAYMLVRTLMHFNTELGIPNTISGLDISKEDFKANLDEMVDSAFVDKCLPTNPREVSKDQIRSLFIKAYYGTENKDIL